MTLGVAASARRRSASTILHIGSANGATSATPAAHVVGDFMLGVSYKASSASFTTLPSGWTSIGTTPTNGSAPTILLAYKVAASTSDGNDTWTGANGVIIDVYRNVSGIGGFGLDGAATSATLTFPGFTGSARQKTDGTSWIARCFATLAAATVLTIPAGYSNRFSNTRFGLIDSNAGLGAEGSAAGSFSASATYKTMTVELLN